MEAVVLFACMYNVGCSEAASTYYLSDTQLQANVHYSEQMLKQKLGERSLLIVGSSFNIVLGRDFVVPITANISMKGKLWDQLLLSYSWRF